MARHVTIEGSLTPCVELPTGEQKTVTWTPRIDSLVEKGFIVIVADSGETPAQDAPEPEAEVEDDEDDDIEPPANNASRVAWANFLASQNISVPEDATRDNLIHLWQQASGGS